MENNISIEDLGYYVGLLDLATSRGCLQGEDLYPAGVLRQKLINLSSPDGTISEQNQITIQDLSTIINLIEIMAKKGGLTGEELLPVGTARSKLVNFITANQAINQNKENISSQDEKGEMNG